MEGITMLNLCDTSSEGDMLLDIDNNKMIITEKYNKKDYLVEHQLQIEEEMLTEAQAIQLSSLLKSTERKEWSTGVHELAESKPGKVYVKSSSHAMLDRVIDFMSPPKEGQRGRLNAQAKLLRDSGLRPDVIAWLTAKVVFNSINVVYKHSSSKGTSPKVSSVCHAIGKVIHDESRVTEFRDEDRGQAKLLEAVIKQADKSKSKTNRVKNIHKAFHMKNKEWTVWSDSERGKVGMILLEIFIAETGLVEKGGPSNAYLIATEEFNDHWHSLLPKQMISYMKYRPMVVPPKPWTTATLFRGGYVSEKTKRYPIIKGSAKRDIPRFLKMDWSQVLPAINAIQETPWRVNKTMLEAVQWMYYDYAPKSPTFPHITGIGKLVSCEKMPFPDFPADIEDPEVKKANMRVCGQINAINSVNVSRRRSVIMTINAAKIYAQYDRIYFPHDMDSRGRAYPVTNWLTPQAADFSKSMLEFADGHQINDAEDAEWLMIHGANTYGNDKVSLKERMQWTLDNEEMILSIATDYKTDLRWFMGNGDVDEVSEPFAFLRFCLEWKGYKDYGYGFTSHIVIPVDATCSGLQHYAAMLCDEVGGRSVNLVPGLSRQDIYADVARVALSKLHADGSDTALRWIGFGVDRKMTKRQVMVVPYAGKFSSCMEYTRESVQNKVNQGKEIWFDLKDRELEEDPIILLSKCIWEAISEVVLKGKEGMKWLGQVATLWTAEVNKQEEGDAYSRRMSWTTPDGFEVIQYRSQAEHRQIETVFGGRLKISMYEETGKLESRNMNSSLAPNFIHALDATLLRMTVNKATETGITSFAMIHDSFGVHAPLMKRFLKECIKPSMYHLYADRDVLQEFADTFPGLSLPPQPERGSLDLTGILDSEFVFS